MKNIFTLLFIGLTGLVFAQSHRMDALQTYQKQILTITTKSLEAKFSADKTQGQAPLSIQFTDQSSGNPTSWKWYFGDGDSSIIQHPSHIYTTPGKFDVKLIVSDGISSYALEKKEFIKVLYNYSACDTMHSPLPEPLTYYAIAGGKGYVSGNNSYGDKAVCDYFENLEPNLVITGVLLDFAKAKKISSSDEKIPLCIWATNSLTGTPGNIVAADSISLSDFVSDVTNNRISAIEFKNHIPMSASFYMGIMLPVLTGDTLSFWSTAQGKIPVNTAWVLTKDQGWKSAQELWSQGSTTFMISNAIYPKVCKVNGIDSKPEALHYFVYPNPSNDYITIVNQNENTEIGKIRILDLSGKMVFSGNTSNDLTTTINVSQLPKGMYILQIHENQSSFVSKLVIR